MDRQTVRATHRHRFLNFAYPRAEGSLTRNFKRRVSRNAHDKTMHGQTDRQNPGQRNLGCPRADYWTTHVHEPKARLPRTSSDVSHGVINHTRSTQQHYDVRQLQSQRYKTMDTSVFAFTLKVHRENTGKLITKNQKLVLKIYNKFMSSSSVSNNLPCKVL